MKNKTITLWKEEIKRFFTNDVVVAIFFGAPLLYGILFGFVYQKAKVTQLPIAVIDEDQSPLSQKIVEALQDNEVLDVKKLFYGNENIKKEQIKNDFTAIISIPDDFEASILQKKYPEIRIDLNMSNILNANFASKNLQKVLATLKAGMEIEALKKQGVAPEIARKSFESFKIAYHKLYNPAGNYLYFMLPALLGAIMQQVIFLAMALVFARDFEDGYFKKLLNESKNPFYIIWIKFVPYILLSAFVWTMIGIIFEYFQIDFQVFNFPMLLVVIMLTLAAMFIGMLFSILIPNRLKATEFLMVISTPAFILSGFTWPLSAMPHWVTNISNSIPLTHFLTAFKKIAMYGGNISDIYPELKSLSLIAVISFILMAISLLIKIKKQSSIDIKKQLD